MYCKKDHLSLAVVFSSPSATAFWGGSALFSARRNGACRHDKTLEASPEMRSTRLTVYLERTPRAGLAVKQPIVSAEAFQLFHLLNLYKQVGEGCCFSLAITQPNEHFKSRRCGRAAALPRWHEEFSGELVSGLEFRFKSEGKFMDCGC